MGPESDPSVNPVEDLGLLDNIEIDVDVLRRMKHYSIL